MVAILRFIAPSGKSFITRASSAHMGPVDVHGRIWDKVMAKYGYNSFRKEILWNKRGATDVEVTRKFNSLLREYEPEYN
jgi:hypothetical protein